MRDSKMRCHGIHHLCEVRPSAYEPYLCQTVPLRTIGQKATPARIAKEKMETMTKQGFLQEPRKLDR